MKLKQSNKRNILFSLFILLFCMGKLSAQGLFELPVSEPVEIKMPSISKLEVNWWQYFETATTEDELDKRIKEFMSDISNIVKESKNKESSENSILVINELFTQFHKQKFIVKSLPETKTAELQDSYTIQELIEINTEKNEIINALNENQDEIINITNKITATKKEIDQLKVDYLDQITPFAIFQIGLQWIDKRVRQALDDLRLKRLNNKSENFTKNILIIDNLITQASDKFVLNKSKKPLEDTGILKEKQEKIQLKIDELNLKLAQDFADTDDAKLKYEIDKLDLTLASIEKTKYDLLLNKNTQIVLLEQYLETKSVDIELLRMVINDSDELLEQIEDRLDAWQKTSQNTLLEPSLKSSDKSSKKTIKLDKSKRDKAQKITTESENIRTLKNDNLFNLNLLKIKLVEVETGLSKAWNSIKDFSKGTLKVVKNLIYNPLFTINEYPVTLLPLIKLLLIILIGYIVSKIVNYFIIGYEKKHKIDRTRNRSSLYLMHRLTHYLILFIVIMTGLSTLGINLGNITLIAGALSVGIGFGLQNLVSNFVSGLTIMIEKTLSVGDYIELEDGTTGVIKEIKSRSTRLNTNDNIDVIIPNSDMVTNKIVNWTLKESIRRIKIPFGVAYGTDKELVKKAALEAAENVEYTLTNMTGKEPDVRMDEFADNSVNYILIVWVAHYGLRRPNRMKSYYLWALDTALNKYHIQIPFPQRDVHLNIVKPEDKDEIDEINEILKTEE